MMKKISALLLVVPLLSLTACYNSGEPQAPARTTAPSAITQTQQAAQNQTGNASIDSQIQDLNQHNGTINPQDQKKLNNAPYVPGAFKQ